MPASGAFLLGFVLVLHVHENQHKPLGLLIGLGEGSEYCPTPA